MDARLTRRCAAILAAIVLMAPMAGIAQTTSHKNKPAADSLSPFVGGMARIIQDGRSYYIDRQGKRLFDKLVRISIRRDEPGRLPGTYYVVMRGDKRGVITPQGQWIVKPTYDHIDARGNRHWTVTGDGHKSFVNADGLMLPLKFADIGWMDGVHFDVRKGSHWGIYDAKQHKMVVPAIYDKFDYCGGCGHKSDYAYAEKNGKWGVLSFDGKVLVPFRYGHQHYGMRSGDWVTAFTLDGRDVTINIPTGKVFASPTYADMKVVANGMLVARKDGKYGLVSAQGKVVSPFVYTRISQPCRSRCQSDNLLVEQQGKVGVIDTHGNVVVPPKYEDITLTEDFFIATQDGMPLLLDDRGQVVIDKGYSAISRLGKHLFELHDKALVGMYLADAGKTIKPAFSRFDITCLAPHKKYCMLKATDRGVAFLYSLDGKRLLGASHPFVGTLWRRVGPHLVTVGRHDHLGLYDLAAGKPITPEKYASFRSLEGSNGKLILAQPANYGTSPAIYERSGKLIAKAGSRSIRKIRGNDQVVVLRGDRDALLDLDSGRVHTLPLSFFSQSGAPQLIWLRKNKQAPLRLYRLATHALLPGHYAPPHCSDCTSKLAKAHDFHGGLRKLKTSNGFTLVDTSGKPVTSRTFDVVPLISKQGIALVGNKTLDKWGDPVLHVGYLDRHGKLIVATDYHFKPSRFSHKGLHADRSDYFLDNGLLRLYQQQLKPPYETRIGVANASGVILPPRYKRITAYAKGQYLITENGDVRGVFDAHGVPIVAPARQKIHRACRANRSRSRADAPLRFPLLVERDGTLRYYRADGSTLSLTGTDMVGFTSFGNTLRYANRSTLKHLRCDATPPQQADTPPPPPPPRR